MSLRVRILAIPLAYEGGMALHTATSGAVPGLRELRLIVECDGALAAVGASRTNISYLTGVDAPRLEAEILDAAPRLDWRLPWAVFTAAMDAAMPRLSAPARMLFEMAAQDGAARAMGVPLAEHLGGAFEAHSATNQTLFWCDDDTLRHRAETYVARGFSELKLRIAVEGFDTDLRRLRLLRDRFGMALRLSADANGRWSEAEAGPRLAQLAGLGLEYLEQPLPAADWDGAARLAAGSPLPLMFDESLGDMAAVERLVTTRAVPLAHLKLAKLGGLDRLMTAGRLLQKAGIGVMVGQMNEGVVSTLAAAHAAVALGVTLRELYGADQLRRDPAGGLVYRDGGLDLPRGPGIGLSKHAAEECNVLWDHRP
ncbi:mandelate racemase/muconate lactonizing enzyme family protein [Neoroseomonas lacus]|uniref:Chloromuconate cycloisomerase n=1 Tax=Neoroseomonas lacus TaxID=287609 RepID=A0A917KKQ3_9PROT|nr:mandelate racemase/muconate lactonizing enzyme family protein [Neoroseomonas lacus]GGJ18236.1 chloromuconate cycloisomerase [Neoroseomonas lacus]